jgi:hypothetical protein
MGVIEMSLSADIYRLNERVAIAAKHNHQHSITHTDQWAGGGDGNVEPSRQLQNKTVGQSTVEGVNISPY